MQARGLGLHVAHNAQEEGYDAYMLIHAISHQGRKSGA